MSRGPALPFRRRPRRPDLIRTSFQAAYNRVKTEGVEGSSTACILVLDRKEGILRSATLGDSGFLVVSSEAAAIHPLPLQAPLSRQGPGQMWGSVKGI